jgi:hypothetical protein
MCQHDSDEQLLTYFRTYELCIITAKAEELHVILNAINPLDVQIPRRYRFSSRPGFHSQDIYTSYFILENGHTLPFYITSCSDQGIQNFAIETTSLFNKLEPKFAIHAGVCAAAESLDPEV